MPTPSSKPRSLPDEADRLLTELWRQLATSTGEVEREDVAHRVRHVVTVARDAGFFPEQLIVAVKRSWSAQHELRMANQSEPSPEMLADVISACIAEFYGATVRAPSRGGHSDEISPS